MVRQESRPHNTGSASGRLTCILGPDSNRDCPSIQVQSRLKVWCSPAYRQVEKTPAVVGRRNQCEGERECVRPVPPPAVVGTCSSRLSRDVTCPPLADVSAACMVSSAVRRNYLSNFHMIIFSAAVSADVSPPLA
jgi:hypothetical protein